MILTSYVDATGKTRTASRDALDAVRNALGDIPDAKVRVVWDGSVPYGYHEDGDTFVISAPRQAHAPKAKKSWGVFVPLAAAHSRRSWGAGDLGDLLRYREWSQQHGADYVATLPLLAAFDDEPSPYSPVSRLYWNELYLDVERLPEYREGDRDDAGIAHLNQLRDVDYAGVRRAKRRVLEKLAERWTPSDDFARDYAEWRAAHEQKDSVRYHRYVQTRIAEQMRALGKSLYLDFPIGVNGGGYDVHCYPDSFVKGMSVGAPPDAFFTKGQNWGFPPLHPDVMRARRYDYFRAAIRHHVSHAGVLRLDHVMGLHRLFWIPDGMEAKDGVYVEYPAEELYAIVVLESHLHECAIVGEDLGTVPDYVPSAMAALGLRRMFVIEYEAALRPPDAATVASVNTHDMPPWAAWWDGQDIEDRLEHGLLDALGAREEREKREEIRRTFTRSLHAPYDRGRVLVAALEWLAASEAEIVLVNLEDLWGERVPQNVPGMPERSWRHKLREGLEETMADTHVRNVLTRIQERRKADGNEK
jgi:4-alpha-glucanotransferase